MSTQMCPSLPQCTPSGSRGTKHWGFDVRKKKRRLAVDSHRRAELGLTGGKPAHRTSKVSPKIRMGESKRVTRPGRGHPLPRL